MSVGKRKWTDKKGIKHECWEYCVTIQKSPRLQKKKSGFKKRSDAVAAASKIEESLRKGEQVNNQKLTFADCTEIFMRKQFAKNTRSKYETSFKLHILPFFGKRLMCDINSQTPEIWTQTLIKKGIGIAMVNDCIKMCKAQCNYLLRKKIIYNNPFEYTEKVKATKKRTIKCFSTRQAVRMLSRRRWQEGLGRDLNGRLCLERSDSLTSNGSCDYIHCARTRRTR